MKKITVFIGWAEKNYSAYTDDFTSLNGIIVATGKTLDRVKKEFESALQFHIDSCKKDGDNLSKWLLYGQYEIEYKLETSALLHSFDGILTRAALSRATGINQRQIGHYASGIRTPRPEQRKRIIDGIHKISRELASVM